MTSHNDLISALNHLTSAIRSAHAGPPLTYDINAAAERLGSGFTVDWLRGHLAEIPHIKAGDGSGRAGRISFTDAHLERMVAMFTVEPKPGTNPGDFTPLTRRRAS